MTASLDDHALRRLHARLVAGLVRRLGADRLHLAEDVAQDALVRALEVWPYSGLPERPGAWLFAVARRRALDVLRRERSARDAIESLARFEDSADDADSARDDSLRLILAACHPSLPHESQVALVLRTLCGLSVEEIARALLVEPGAIQQRLTRARRQLRDVELELPEGTVLAERVDAATRVLYLLFSEGHHATSGEALVRRELVDESLRLGALLASDPATARPQVHALLALMHLSAARAPARTAPDGLPVPLAQQDRSLWDRRHLAAGAHHFAHCMTGDRETALHLEAAIASRHASAATYADTDWPSILALYDRLTALAPSPVVALNRAVAVAKVEGAERGLEALSAVGDDPRLARTAHADSVRALLAWVAGHRAEADAAFAAALEGSLPDPSRSLLERRRAACAAGAPPPAW